MNTRRLANNSRACGVSPAPPAYKARQGHDHVHVSEWVSPFLWKSRYHWYCLFIILLPGSVVALAITDAVFYFFPRQVFTWHLLDNNIGGIASADGLTKYEAAVMADWIELKRARELNPSLSNAEWLASMLFVQRYDQILQYRIPYFRDLINWHIQTLFGILIWWILFVSWRIRGYLALRFPDD